MSGSPTRACASARRQAPESYLNPVALLAAAEITGADAIHPGYGFLSENADFAQMVEEHGFTFIGPSPEHIRLMGDKIVAKATARELGIPTVPGSEGPIDSEAEAIELAHEIGFPVLIKAVAGGGGRGMTVVRAPDELADAVRMARNEARAAFGDDRVYVERFLDRPAPHRGPGDRRRQGPRRASGRARLLAAAAPSEGGRGGAVAGPRAASSASGSASLVVEALRQLNYRSLGTVEFLYEDGEFFFIEMNTRLQVEHPVTELVTGIDLVREQIKLAAGAAAELHPERRPVHRARDRGPDQRRGPAHPAAHARAGRWPSMRRAARACAWIRPSMPATPCRRTTTA